MLLRRAAKLGFALAIALLPAGAFAQGQTGSIAGVGERHDGRGAARRDG